MYACMYVYIYLLKRSTFWLINFSCVITDTNVWGHLSDASLPMDERENGLIAINVQQQGRCYLLQKQSNKSEGSFEISIKSPFSSKF